MCNNGLCNCGHPAPQLFLKHVRQFARPSPAQGCARDALVFECGTGYTILFRVLIGGKSGSFREPFNSVVELVGDTHEVVSRGLTLPFGRVAVMVVPYRGIGHAIVASGYEDLAKVLQCLDSESFTNVLKAVGNSG